MQTTPRAILKRLIPVHRSDPGLIWENLARTALVITVMIVPWLVLPITNDGWEIHKTAALLVLTSLAWIFTWVSVWRRREHVWTWRRIDAMILALVIVAALSTWLSVDTWIGLTGTSGAMAETLPVLFALASWWWLWPQVFQAAGPRQVLWAGLSLGLVGALLFQALQFFGFPFAPTLSSQPLFSLISQSPLDTALIAAVVGTVALAAWSRTRERWQHWLTVAILLLSWLVLFFLQQPVAWGAFALGMIGLVVLESRQGSNARAGLVVGAVMLAGLGLVTQVTNLPSLSAVPRSVEIRMDASASWAVTSATLAKHPLIGTGPNTWYQAFTRYRTTEFNSSAWWNVRFIKAQNAWSQWLATYGIIGTAIWLSVLIWMGWLAWRGWRTNGHIGSLLAVYILAVTVISGFFMTWSLVWWMIIWATLAWLRLLSIPDAAQPKTIGPVVMAGAAVAVIGVIWFWYPATRIYASEVAVDRAQVAIARTQPLKDVQILLEAALRYNPRNLAAAELLGHAFATQAELATQSGQSDQAVEHVRSALTAVQPSLALRPKDPAAREFVNNLLNRLSPYVSDAEEGARENFVNLRQLEPASPIHDVGYGQTLLVTRSRILSGESVTEDAKAQAEKMLGEAQAAFATALQKKADYLPARIASAQALNLDNQPTAALAELDKVVTNGAAFSLYWRERGNAESKLGRDEAATAAYDAALKIDPQDVTTYLAYSQHYQAANLVSSARNILESGLKVLPDHPVLKQALVELAK